MWKGVDSCRWVMRRLLADRTTQQLSAEPLTPDIKDR